MGPLWAEFRSALGQPEYLHVLLNPIPVYGLATALAALIAAWIVGHRPGQAAALILVALTAASAWPAAHFGHAGYDRVYSLSDPAAQAWLNWHERLGDRLVWVFTAAAVLAAVAAWAVGRNWRSGRIWLKVAFIASLAAWGGGGCLAFVGGKIRHAEFREGPPPASAKATSDYQP